MLVSLLTMISSPSTVVLAKGPDVASLKLVENEELLLVSA